MSEFFGAGLALGHFLALGAVLFCISVAGIFLNRKNVIVLLMSIELMLLAVNINFVAFSHHLAGFEGQIFAIFVITIAAGEAAVGLAIIIQLYRLKSSVNVDDARTLNG